MVGSVGRYVLFSLMLLALFLQAGLARPLELEDVLDLKTPGDSDLSSNGDVAFLVERYLNTNPEITMDRKWLNEAELWLRRRGEKSKKIGVGGGFVSFSPDGRFLATGSPNGDGYGYRVFDLESGEHRDYGFTQAYTLYSAWSSEEFFFVDELPRKGGTIQVLDTKHPRMQSIDRLTAVKNGGQTEVVAEGMILDVTASSAHPLVAWREVAAFPDLPEVVEGWQGWSERVTLLDRQTGRRISRTFAPLGEGTLHLDWERDGRALFVRSPEGDLRFTTDKGIEVATPSRSEKDSGPPVSTSLHQVEFEGEILWQNDPALREVNYGRVLELKGDGMSHWLMLPDETKFPKPREGYPVITWVYPAERFPEKPRALTFTKLGKGDYTISLFCSRGYALYLPSIYPANSTNPDRGIGVTTANHEPAAEMNASYEASLVPLRESGLVDMKRIAVAGHSGGGNLAMEIAASDIPVKTALAFSGVSDRALWYWGFPPQIAADPQPEILLWKYIYFSWAESGQGDMGVPPWKDEDRWTRNSPVYRSDQITCPLLLITGASEGPHAEAMFTALLRQNKRARMVRFWDEPHYVRGRENYRILWKELFAWLDENL